LEKTEEKPLFEEAEAFRTLLFDEGRFCPRKSDPVKVKDLPYRSSNISNVFVRNAFENHRRIERAERREKKEIYFRIRRDPEPVEVKFDPYVGVNLIAKRVNDRIVEARLHERTLMNPIKIREEEVKNLKGRSR